MKKVCLYVRVSTSKQTVENQIRELTEYSDRCGYSIVEIYRDEGISGSKGRDERPSLDRMLKDGVRRKFDMVLCWSVDRLGRSVSHLVHTMNELHENKIDIFFLQQGIDTSTSTGRLVFGIFSCISEMEKVTIRERVISGLERVKKQGKKLGRPTKMNDGMRSAVRLLREKGIGIKQISQQLEIGVGTVYSVLN
jgi:DNA invertase Pin-like site-specific DNA recombinase